MSNQPTTQIPVQLARRRLDTQNPTLIPNLSLPVSSGNGTLDVMDPTAFLTKFPRTSAAVTATIGGTVTVGNVVTLKLTWGILPGGSQSYAYTVISGDTLETIATALVNLINTNAVSQTYGISATQGNEAAPDAVIVTLYGPVANSATLSFTSPGTETVTLSPSGGKFTGATGPIIPIQNFQMAWNGTMSKFWYGQPANVGLDMVAAMVAQGVPII